jgi:tetratricopeptide (TPR) repeat protein
MSTWPDFNDLWDYGDPEGTEQAFRELLAEAESSGDQSYHLQLLTQIARTYSLRKNFDEAHNILDLVQSNMAGEDIVEVRYLLERGRTYNSANRVDEALDLFHKAVGLGAAIGEDYYSIDALHMLGISAPSEELMTWNLKAIEAAENSSDEHASKWLSSLYNNTGWTLFDDEKFDDALDLFQKAQELRESEGKTQSLLIAKWCVAKTLRALGRLDEALDIQRALVTDPEHSPFVEEEMAECLLAMGNQNDAKPYFKIAFEALSEIDWVAEDTERIERLKKLSE